MADAAQRAIQLAIVWFLKKRRAKRARMIEEKRSSFLYIYITGNAGIILDILGNFCLPASISRA